MFGLRPLSYFLPLFGDFEGALVWLLSFLPDVEGTRDPDRDLAGDCVFFIKSTGGAGLAKCALMFTSPSPNGKFKVVVINDPGSWRELCSLKSG